MDAPANISSFTARLANARKNLLDLGCRNRLINTQRGLGRTSRLEIVDERSAEVFRRLVTEQKPMSFLPADEDHEADGALQLDDVDELSFAQPSEDVDDSEPAGRHTDEHLQTSLTSEALQKRLLKLHYDARAYEEEEQGVNILFLALGFIRWYEDDRSTVERHAPLILVPVTLTRRSAGSRFNIAWTQGDLSTSLSLQEKLRHEFGVE